MLVVWLKKQITTQKYQILKRKSLIMKYITTSEFNTMAANVSNARLAQANGITKSEFDAKLSGLNKKITSNKTKHVLVENELKKKKIYAAYFRGKNYFEDGM